MQTTLITQPPASTTTSSNSCHAPRQMDTGGMPLVTIVGSPNVGKSVLFNTLTGIYVTVSNYPGTTVEVTRGKGKFDELETGIMDTPGMYGLLPITEEERVARNILLYERPDLVVHVIDAKNIERMLPMTLQLIEAGLPMVLVVNLMDEADRIGMKLDLDILQASLGIPVLGTALAQGRGAKEIRRLISTRLKDTAPQPTPACCAVSQPDHLTIAYPAAVQQAVARIETLLDGSYSLSNRAMAVLLLQNDREVAQTTSQQEADGGEAVFSLVKATQAQFNQPLSYIIARSQRDAAQRLLEPVLTLPQKRTSSFSANLSRWMINPITGIPILLAALYALYQFVGVLGAQTLVGLLEENFFGAIVNPWINNLLTQLIPWQVLRDLIGGEFGILTLGVRYAVAIVLPIVGTFFLAFSVIEDSGYLPRLALLIDRVFKKIGLNGRAVIPMVLGFGCDTMATIVTRTLETRRERVLSTLLLSLAVPCSAQLGVMLGLLTAEPWMLAVWVLVVSGIFMLVGWLAAKLMPGERPTFYMELPPLRMPTLRNVLVKTYTRMEWYLREVFPLFIIASVLIWFGKLTGLFDLAIAALTPLMRFIGLPDELAQTFLFGFFRRDYGAAGLYDMRATMNNVQLLVAVVTMTLFIPCIAQFSVTVKERGLKMALGMAAFIFPFALLVGGLLNLVLKLVGSVL